MMFIFVNPEGRVKENPNISVKNWCEVWIKKGINMINPVIAEDNENLNKFFHSLLIAIKKK